jgi:deoxyadenosine/deoxycytidine kinase
MARVFQKLPNPEFPLPGQALRGSAVIISIEGNIGSGKSTILDLLKNECKKIDNVIFLQEPVNEWNEIKDNNGITILEKFYADQEKYSFAFQMMAYISRLSLLKKTICENSGAIIITERCLETDRHVFAKMLYDSGKIEEIEYTIYLKWFDEFIDETRVNKMVYLKTSPETSYYRIGKRSRTGESSISLDYLVQCDQYHQNMVNNINIEKMVIQCDDDVEQNSKIMEKWIDKIKNFILESSTSSR